MRPQQTVPPVPVPTPEPSATTVTARSAPTSSTAPPSGLEALDAALVAEACRRSGVVWVSPNPADRWYVAWHVWHEDAVHLVSGPDEQELPPLRGEVLLTVPSKDTGSRLVTLVAWAEVLAPGSPAWEAAATALTAARLNEPAPDTQHRRWAETAELLRLVPTRMLGSGPGDDTTPSGASQPAPSPATTGGRRPFHFGGRTRRWRRVRG